MISEERLRQAAGAAVLALADSLPEPEECQHEFSPGFEQKMRKVLRRGNHPTVYRRLRRAACFLLAILLSGSVWLTVDTEAREVVFGWISERVEGAYHYFFRGERTSQDYLTGYTLSKIPEGYKESNQIETEEYSIKIFVEASTGNYLTLGWLHPSESTEEPELFFLTGDMKQEMVQVNEQPAEFYWDETGEKGNVIVWCDRKTDTLLYISDYFNKEMLTNLAEDVKPDK